MSNNFTTKAGFAESQGWTRSYAFKLAKEGRLVYNDEGDVDISASLERIKKTGDPAKSRAVRGPLKTKKNMPAKPVIPDVTADDYMLHKAKREAALAAMADLDLEKQRGNLVDRERVNLASVSIGRSLRDSLMGLPPQLAASVVGMTDTFAIEKILRDALRACLSDAAKLAADDLDRVLDDS